MRLLIPSCHLIVTAQAGLAGCMRVGQCPQAAGGLLMEYRQCMMMMMMMIVSLLVAPRGHVEPAGTPTGFRVPPS